MLSELILIWSGPRVCRRLLLERRPRRLRQAEDPNGLRTRGLRSRPDPACTPYRRRGTVAKKAISSRHPAECRDAGRGDAEPRRNRADACPLAVRKPVFGQADGIGASGWWPIVRTRRCYAPAFHPTTAAFRVPPTDTPRWAAAVRSIPQRAHQACCGALKVSKLVPGLRRILPQPARAREVVDH